MRYFLMSLEKEIFVCLDCETTGLDPQNDRIIEIAAIRFTLEESLARFETLIDPECPISEASIQIHHITQEMVEGKATIDTVLPSLFEFVGRSPIVGHGIFFDIDILREATTRAKIPFKLALNPLIDTHRLARLYGKSPINSLNGLREHFHIDFEIAHRAMNDVIINIEVFKKLCKDFKKLDSIYQALSKPILLKEMPLGKHKGRSLREIPLDYLLWAANKDFDQDLLFSIRSEIKRRRQGNHFLEAASPFKKL